MLVDQRRDTATSENRLREGFLEESVLEEKEDLNMLTQGSRGHPRLEETGKHKSMKVEKCF